MRLVPEWKRILRKAWSIRLMLLAGLFSGAEVVVPLFVDAMPRNVFAVLCFACVSGATIARVVAQQGIRE